MLHRLIYISAICGVIHYLWLVKADIRKPLEYGAILAVSALLSGVVWILPKFTKRSIPLVTRAQPIVE